MRCVIPGRSVKLFAKAIHCLSKIGCELYLEALSEGLALRTVSSSRSAYACFLFNESFFISYDDGSSDIPADSQEEDLFKCKIAMKSCLSAFKSMNTIEKTVDQCKIDLNVRETRLVFLLYCRHGITKTYNLTFQECETLQAVFSKDLCPNFMTAQAKILNDAVYNFPNNQEEITLCVCPETFKVKNYVDDEPDPNRVIHTEMMLVPDEFDNYQIGVDTDVTFCLKELRAILVFAEFSSQPINVHFETSGKPIVFSMDGDPTYEADFVLATLVDHDSSTQSSQASVTAAANSQQPSTSKVSKDKQVTSSAKRNLPPQSREKTRGKTAARLHNNTSVSQNSRRSDHVNNNERDDSMFNDDDDDLDITEIDQADLCRSTSSAKRNLPPQSREKTRGKTAARLHNNTSVSQNSRRSDHVNNNERDDSMFNDDDDDLDITEIDQALLDGKAPVSSQNTEEKDNSVINHKDPVKTDPVSRSQRSADANKSSVLDDFFGDSFPYQDLFTTGKRELSVIPEASQESANTSVRSAKPIQTPPSSVAEVSFMKNVDMPSLGDSCLSPEGSSLKQSGPKKTRSYEPDDSLMDVIADEDYDFIPGTPPHKKFKSMFFSASKSQGVSQDVVLAADSDED